MPDSTNLKMETNIAVAMRDGVTLYADIYRPCLLYTSPTPRD